MLVIFEDESGNEICRVENLSINEKQYFEIPKHYYNINMLIISDTEEAYESVTIRTIS